MKMDATMSEQGSSSRTQATLAKSSETAPSSLSQQQQQQLPTPDSTTPRGNIESAQPLSEDAIFQQCSDEETLPNEEKCGGRPFFIKLALGLLLLSLITFIIVDSATNGYVKDAVDDFLNWVEENPVPGIFLFSLVYFVATVLFIPGSILTLGAGFVFSSAFGLGGGVVLGTLSVFVGASLGAMAAFLLGRYLLREHARKLTVKYAAFEALDAAFQDNGLKIFVLLRLSPIIPFNAINYVGGVTSVSFAHYALALLAILPGTLLYVFLGASAGTLSDSASGGDSSIVTLIVVCVGLLFGFLAVWFTARLARAELDRIMEERRGETTEEADESDGEPESTV